MFHHLKARHSSKKIIGGMFFLLLSLIYGWHSLGIPLFSGEIESFTARTLPLYIAATGVVLSILLLVLPDEDKDFVVRIKKMDWFSTGALFVLMSIYGLIFNYLGFFLSTFLFLNGGFYILGERRIGVMLLVSVTLIAFFWGVFNYLLGIYIDPGLFWLDLLE